MIISRLYDAICIGDFHCCLLPALNMGILGAGRRIDTLKFRFEALRQASSIAGSAASSTDLDMLQDSLKWSSKRTKVDVDTGYG